MRLKKIQIKSYRSCINTKIHFDNDLTTLIGINGAGKSNILNAILLFRKIFRLRNIRSHEKDESYNSCSISAELMKSGKTLYMKASIDYLTDERNLDDVMSIKFRWNFREYINNHQWFEIPIEFFTFNKDEMLSSGFRMDWKFIKYSQYLFSKLPGSVQKVAKELLPDVAGHFSGINYYSASQFSDPSRCPVSIELEENRPLRKLRQSMGHEQFMLDLYRSFKAGDAQYKRYISTVNKEGIGLIDDIDYKEINMPASSFEVQVGGKIKKVERSRFLIVPAFVVNNCTLSPNQLSEGTFKTLALLFYILTDDSKLLLIEEPEVCIHHGLLNSIIDLIISQAKQMQIVISTHSDYVLDKLIPENVVLVKRDSKKGTIASLLNKSLSRNDFKALKEYLRVTGNLGEYWREGGLEND